MIKKSIYINADRYVLYFLFLVVLSCFFWINYQMLLKPEITFDFMVWNISFAFLFFSLGTLHERKIEEKGTMHFKNFAANFLELIARYCFIATNFIFITFLMALTWRLLNNSGYFAIALPNNPESVAINITKMHLALVTLLISGFGLAGAWWANRMWKRAEKIDDDLKTMDKTKKILAQNVLQTAEIAIQHLMANPAYTQQISIGTVHGLQFLESIIGTDSDADNGIMKSLQDSNHAMLRYAYAIYLLGLNPKHHMAISNLDDVIKNCNKSSQIFLFLLVQYRKAILLRQIGDYEGAKNIYTDVFFKKIKPQMSSSNKFWLSWGIRMQTGLLINELAQEPFWRIDNGILRFQKPKNAKKISECIDNILNLPIDEDKLDDNVKYYLMKAIALLKVTDPSTISTDAKSFIDTKDLEIFINNIKKVYRDIYDKYWEACEKAPNKFVDGYCLMLLENFDFCIGMMDIYKSILKKDNAIDIETLKKHFCNMSKEFSDFEQDIDEMKITLPEKYVDTVYSEKLEREIRTYEFKKEMEDIIKYLKDESFKS